MVNLPYLIINIMKFTEEFKKIESKHFINGNYVPSRGQDTYQVINPATEGLIGLEAKGNIEDVDLAVQTSRQAFKTWSQTDAVVRGRILYKVSQLIIKNIELLSYFESLNCGKPISKTSSFEIPFTSYIYSYFAGQADKIKGSTLPMMHPYVGMTIKEPIGVVGAILPWNYPLALTAWKVAAALAAGCTVVLKPAEQTPYTSLLLGEIFNQAGVPPGVVNIVTGEGQTGELISTHKGVNKIAFTGSTQVGYKIMRNSHKENLKSITLELGGKSALIVCQDTDLDEAVPTSCYLWNNCGQSCISASRCFVHESIYDQFIQKCVKFAETVVHGDPMDPKTNQGPVIDKTQFEKILWYISEGKREGAKVAVGGERWGEKGYYIKPTIFYDVEDNMRIAREEIFGPVISILKWKDDDEVIKRANSLPYGLGAGVLTPNINRAIKFAKGLHAGMVYINNYEYMQGCTPFGGFNDSGIGKDLGDEGIEGFLLTKTVIIKVKI